MSKNYASIWTELCKLSLRQDYVDAGVQTRYVNAGPKSAPKLIMLHGMGGSWENLYCNLVAHAEHFDTYGYDTGPAFLEALKGAIDVVAAGDLVYGACFHDWVALASDERRVGWLRGMLRFAVERGVEVTTYTDYWRRRADG